MDFRDDAALHLLSASCISLLRLHHPTDIATLLALESGHHAAKVLTEPDFTNTVLAVEYMFRNAGGTYLDYYVVLCHYYISYFTSLCNI